MINSLNDELRAIAQSILNQEDNLDIASLEERIRILQKQLAIIEYEQKNKTQVSPIEKREELVIKKDRAKAEVVELDNLFSKPVNEPVFIRKESEDTIEKEKTQQTSRNLNDTFEQKSTLAKEHVFAKKESENAIEEEKTQQVPKNLNDTLGRGLKIGLNDRLAFIKNLFNENAEEYQRVINQLQTYQDFEEAHFFLENLVKPEYNSWEGKEAYKKRFYQIIEKTI